MAGWGRDVLSALKRALPVALPIMLGYVVIGVPAGILEAEIGLTPWMAFMLSATYYSGAGQFMLSNLWLAGQGPLAIAASISLVNTRQLLYSAAFAPRFAKEPKGVTALFAATVTDESFGVNTERFAVDPQWGAADACAVNLLSLLSWASANALGGAVGDLLAMPTEVASFAMTAIFVCLLLTQVFSGPKVSGAVMAALATVLCKVVGAGSVAIVCGAVAGVLTVVALDREPRDTEDDGALRDAEEVRP